MIERQIESPSPRPPGLVVQKDSKRRSIVAGVSPGPASYTATSTAFDSVFPTLIRQLARSITEATHCFHDIDDQIKNDLCTRAPPPLVDKRIPLDPVTADDYYVGYRPSSTDE